MNTLYRKIIFNFSFFLILNSGLFAQQNHFIYLQTENKQPFYAKLDKKILSSSASGYLIIPKLQDGNYILTIGFPKNEWPEQSMVCTINKADAGYLLKNFADKGWGLFNLQTLAIVMSGAKPNENRVTIDENKGDIFSNTLSNVVNDPSIAKKTESKAVIKEEEKSVEIPGKKEESVNKAPDLPTMEVIEAKKVEVKPVEPVKISIESEKNKEPALSISQIKKLFSVTSSEGQDMVYVDITNGQADTIRIFIPVIKRVEADLPEKKTDDKLIELTQKADNLNVASKKEEIKNVEPKFLDIDLPVQNAKTDTVIKQSLPIPDTSNNIKSAIESEKPKENIVKAVIVNSDCKNFATEDDFLKLRKKMASETNDDNMVNVAKKVFRSKCFTTEQVKNLSVLYLKDEGKYKFFDAAYPFVSDSYNFGSLEAQLIDDYFISRFKAMIRH